MPITLHFEDDARSICRLDFEGAWSLKELKAVGDAVDQHHLAYGPGVVILNMTRGKSIPDRLVDHVAMFSAPPHSMLGAAWLFVVVGSSRVGWLLFNSFSRLFRNNTLAHRTVFVDTLEEARQLIQERQQA